MSSLTSYSPLGPTGLRVCRLGLATRHLGSKQTDGVGELIARYLDAGGNYVDTSDAYQPDESEPPVGEYLHASGRRDGVVLAARSSHLHHTASDTRTRIQDALEASLRRLRTDRIDLYWLRAWDGRTPIEEILELVDELVRAGKILQAGLIDVPAWYLTRACTLAELRGHRWLGAVSLQYTLMARHVELEYIPAALALGLGVSTYNALGGGLLTGKFRRDGRHAPGRHGLLEDFKGHRGLDRVNAGAWTFVESLVEIAGMIGCTPAQVALSWAANRPGVTTTLVSVTTSAQLAEDLRALECRIPEMLDDRLEAAFRPDRPAPYDSFTWDFMRAQLGRR